MVAVWRRAWWAGHATVKGVVRIHLLVGIAVKLRWKLIALLDIESEAAVNCLIGISWMALLPEVALRQRGVLGKWRSRGLRMVRPDITLTIVVEGTIQTTLIVSAGQLWVYSSAVEEIRVWVTALSTSAVVERAELVIPRLARKATRVPGTDAMTMALIHGSAPECEKGVRLGSEDRQYQIAAFTRFDTYLKPSVCKKRVVPITRVVDRLKSEFVINRKNFWRMPQVVGFRKWGRWGKVPNSDSAAADQRSAKKTPTKSPTPAQCRRKQQDTAISRQRSNQGEQPATGQTAGGVMRASGNMAPTRPRSGICRLKIRG